MLFKRKRMHEPTAGGGGWAREEEPLPELREWTIMVYLAGDNNLEKWGEADLLEMKTVGSTPEVAIVAQFDRLSRAGAWRYYITQGGHPDKDIVAELSEINTGDPRELTRFIAWGIENYPARRYALVIWNHGTGWKEDDIYRIARQAGVCRATNQQALAPLVRQIASRTKRAPLFSTTINAVLARGIAYDDSSADFLDNAELKRAIASALLATATEKLDLLGFDACLMSMIEVAYQLRDVAEFMVGSQETEPAAGWPYHTILQRLVQQPYMGPQELGAAIVEEYIAHFQADEALTQSSLDLEWVRDITFALNDMCSYIVANLELCELTVGRVSRMAQRYTDPDYKDLYDFCRLLRERTSLFELQARAQTVMDLIAPPGADRFVSAEAHRGPRLARSNGVSIYFPGQELSPFYGRLDFASECLWDDMLLRMFGLAS